MDNNLKLFAKNILGVYYVTTRRMGSLTMYACMCEGVKVSVGPSVSM